MKKEVMKAKKRVISTPKSRLLNIKPVRSAKSTKSRKSPQTSKKSAPKPVSIPEPEQASFESTRKTNVVYSLQQIQQKLGYLPLEELIKLSKLNGIPGVDIYSVATFYNQFKLKKPAKYVVSICRGTACHVKNSESLLEYAEKLLNIKVGESTADGLITLEIVRCIGACAKAPAVMVNETVYGNMDKDKLRQLLASLR
jgi:NADH:ubiquinone oxidoreductase subunit E